MDFLLYALMFLSVIAFIVGLLGLCVRWVLAMFAPDTGLYRVSWYISNAGCAASFLLLVVLFLLIFVLTLLGL